MARNKSKGGLSKVLEFIGLVDEEDPRDMENDYNAYEAPAYVPSRQQARTPARVQSTERTAGYRRYEDESYTSPRRTTPLVERVEAPRNSSRREMPRAYENGAPRSRVSPAEVPSRFTPEGQRVAEEKRAAARPSRSRTVMFSLHSLEDCCDVIDNLIMNNTIVLTMEELDPSLTQRAVDTLSGAVFALHATIRRASEKTYLIAPNSVEVNETYDVDRRF